MGLNPVESPEFFQVHETIALIVQQVRGSYIHLISNVRVVLCEKTPEKTPNI